MVGDAWRGCACQGACMAREHACGEGAWQGIYVHGRGHAWYGTCMVGGAWHGGERTACIAGETATAADGTHPTGMHSCLQMLTQGFKYW